ncbi:MAG: SUMF1/EgtB/PvdO family nonheme iron enzyme, partial [Planctomycetota bacterium]
LSAARFFLLNTKSKELKDQAQQWIKIDEARKMAESGNLSGAVELLEQLAGDLKAAKQQGPPDVDLPLLVRKFKAQRVMQQGEQALEQEKWEEAARAFGEVRDLNPPDAAKRDFADKAGVLASKMLSAERARDDAQRRLPELQDALKLAEELKLTKSAGRISNMLKVLNFDPVRFGELLEKGKSELCKTPPDFAKARELFKQAEQYNRGPAVKPYIDYLNDEDFCSKLGMSLFAPSSPARGGAWTGDERREAFCIDRYEWPNKADALPAANVTWLEARQSCEGKGKKLCSLSEWESACKGPDKLRYPYPDAPNKATCNTDGSAVLPSGSRKECRNAIGVYDMSGNLAEWTDRDGDAEVRGGAYDTPFGQASCSDALEQNKAARSPRVGFRCCRRLP